MLFNRTRALEYMRRHRLDALVATSPVNITYFTDYFNWTDALFKGYMTSPGSPPNIGQGYAVFPLEGEPALVVGPFTAVNAGEIWVRDWRLYGDSGLDFSLHDQARPASVDALYEQLRNAPHNASPTAARCRSARCRSSSGVTRRASSAQRPGESSSKTCGACGTS